MKEIPMYSLDVNIYFNMNTLNLKSIDNDNNVL